MSGDDGEALRREMAAWELPDELVIDDADGVLRRARPSDYTEPGSSPDEAWLSDQEGAGTGGNDAAHTALPPDHDPRCMSLVPSARLCDCRIWRLIDNPPQPGEPFAVSAMRDAPDDEAVARMFHDAYERLAPEYGYSTREASAKPWVEVPEQNRALMVATVREVRGALVDSAARSAPGAETAAVGREELCRILHDANTGRITPDDEDQARYGAMADAVLARLRSADPGAETPTDDWPPTSYGPYVALRTFARSLVALEQPTMAESRRAATLADIIDRARHALSIGPDEDEPAAEPRAVCGVCPMVPTRWAHPECPEHGVAALDAKLGWDGAAPDGGADSRP